MNLFVNYYNAGNRQKEIDFCLGNNLAHPLIKRVVVFNEHENIPNHDKIIIKHVSERPTYQDFFDEMKNYPDDINILANSDIYFDESLKEAERINDRQCFAITRWEYNGGHPISFMDANAHNSGCKAEFSQDVWIFKGAPLMVGCDKVIAIKSNPKQYDEIPFTIGVPGCDNIIAVRLKSRYQVINPCENIKCIHVHSDNRRPQYIYKIIGSRNGFWGQVQQGRVPVKNI